MNSGWSALASGLGGVLITALAAYLGPLRLQGRKAEADLALELRREQAGKTAAEATALNTLITKIIEVRVSTALALETYKAVIRDLGNGHAVDWEVFSNESRKRAQHVHEATAGLLLAGVHLQSGGYGDTGPRRRPSSPAEPSSSSALFLDCLDSVNTLIAQIRAGQPPRQEPLDHALTSALDVRLDQAARARRDILDSLIQELEQRHGIRIAPPGTKP